MQKNAPFGGKNPKLASTVYNVIALVFVFLGTVFSSDFVWDLQDLLNNFMVLPNVVALFALTGTVLILKDQEKAVTDRFAGDPIADLPDIVLASGGNRRKKSRENNQSEAI